MSDVSTRAAFFTDEPITAGTVLALTEEDARHANVLRLGVGDRVALRNGAGMVAAGPIVRLARKHASVEVDWMADVIPAPAIHLLVPVADRDRMLWLAEKAAELNVASWRPVLWQRSKSVSPRGDGPTFRAKVRSRMIAALLQSRSAYLPEIYPESPPERALASLPAGERWVFDASGAGIPGTVSAPLVIAIGPEGGFVAEELELLDAAGFGRYALGHSVLRFETAAVAGLGVARAMLHDR